MEFIIECLLLGALQSVGPSSPKLPWHFSLMLVGPNHLHLENRYIYHKYYPFLVTFRKYVF